MMLYHGSATPGLTRLIPFQSNHDRPYVYLTHSPALAALYAHNPMTRPNGWFTYRWDREGRLHYDEYFPGQLAALYQGQTGCVYAAEAELPAMEKMPWIYLSEIPVQVTACQDIPDLMAHLLLLETRGELIVHRYETLSDAARENFRRIVRREIDKNALREHPESEYAMFLHRYMPEVW